jgi:hypothetical protein
VWKGWWWGVRKRQGTDVYTGVRLFLAFIFLTAGWAIRAVEAPAIGRLVYQNSEEAALGLQGSSEVLIFGLADDRNRLARWRAEAGEHRLFALDNLKIDGVSLSAAWANWGAFVSATYLSTPVGSESLLNVEPFYIGNRFLAFSAGVSFNRMVLPDIPDVHLATVSVKMFARLGDALIVGYTVENIRIAGETYPGADAAFHAIVFAGSPVCLLTRLELARDGAVAAGIAANGRLGSRIRAAAGYDDASGGLAGAVTCSFGPVGVSIGADLHPVLGVSKSIFVFWGGGS